MDLSDFFLFSLISLVFGIIFSLFLSIPWIFLGFFIFFGLGIYKKDLGYLLLFLFFLFGFLRGNFFLQALFNSPLISLNDSQNFVELRGEILEEPEIEKNYQKFIFQPDKIFGKIYVFTSNDNLYLKHQKIKIRARLKTPSSFPDFDYKKFLQRQGILSIAYFPEIEVEREVSSFWRLIFQIKEKARQNAKNFLPEKESALFGALILGDKKYLPNDLKEILNKTGIRHISAISGMHIMILMNLLLAFFLWLGFWRKQAGILAILFVFFYLFFIGFQPSAFRASIMGVGLILAQIFGRPPDSLRFLVLAAGIMLLLNPLIFFDVGFQLSFLASLGINYLTSFFSQKLNFLPNLFGIRTIISMSFAAQIFTLPLLLFYFSYFPLISIFANLLVLPVIPLVLALGFLAIILGLIFSYLALFVFFPLSLLLLYIIQTATFLSRFSFLGINFKLPLWLFLPYYLALFFFIRKKKSNLWFLNLG